MMERSVGEWEWAWMAHRRRLRSRPPGRAALEHRGCPASCAAACMLPELEEGSAAGGAVAAVLVVLGEGALT